MEINREIIIKLYEYLFQKTFFKPDFCYKSEQKSNVIIDKFTDLFNQNDSLGKDWLFRFFCFQFQYYYSLKNRKLKTVIPGYIMGITAYERYENRNQESEYFVDKFIKDFNLDPDEVFGDRFYKKDLINLSQAEEVEKRSIPDDIIRLANCINFTTLYNIKSTVCVLCNQSRLCKKIQKETLPQIYNLRNEKNFKEVSGAIT